MSKQKKSKKAKLPAGIDETFLDEVARMTQDEMKEKICLVTNGIDEAKAFLKTQAVLDLKAAYDEAAGPSRDTVKHGQNKIKYLIDELRKNGGLPESEVE